MQCTHLALVRKARYPQAGLSNTLVLGIRGRLVPDRIERSPVQEDLQIERQLGKDGNRMVWPDQLPDQSRPHQLRQTAAQDPVDSLGRRQADVLLDIGPVDECRVCMRRSA